jgi:hypothetical protein
MLCFTVALAIGVNANSGAFMLSGGPAGPIGGPVAGNGDEPPIEDPEPTGDPEPTPTLEPDATPTWHPSSSPSPEETPQPTPTPPRIGGRPGNPVPLPAGVKPSLTQARGDWERIQRDGCTQQYPGTGVLDCVYGDRNGSKTVALVGDSHAAQWFPALERIALDRGWRLMPFTKISCRFLDMRVYSRVLKREYFECTTWRNNVIERLQGIEPDLVVIAAGRGMAVMNEADNDPTRQGHAMARYLERIPGEKAIIADTPQSKFDPPQCISRNVSDVRPCETNYDYAFNWRHLKLEQAAARDTGAALIDLSHRICSRDPCEVVRDGYIVYRDYHHMTATFAASLAPALAAGLPDID